MGKCILAGHPPAGGGLKIAYGTSTTETVNIASYKFKTTPVVVAALKSGYAGIVIITQISSTSISFWVRGATGGSISDWTIEWIAVGT